MRHKHCSVVQYTGWISDNVFLNNVCNNSITIRLAEFVLSNPVSPLGDIIRTGLGFIAILNINGTM